MLKQVILSGALGLVLLGCETGREVTIDPDLGNAVRHNVAVQTINPDAGGPDGSSSIDGQRAADAVERMRTRSTEAETSSLIQSVGSGN